jgi:hypothetical protein
MERRIQTTINRERNYVVLAPEKGSKMPGGCGSMPHKQQGHTNPQMWSATFQCRRAKEFLGKDCIDKSVSRRSIGRKYELTPGAQTVRYIRENLAVAWLTADDLVGEIPFWEVALIQELKPILNKRRN